MSMSRFVILSSSTKYFNRGGGIFLFLTASRHLLRHPYIQIECFRASPKKFHATADIEQAVCDLKVFIKGEAHCTKVENVLFKEKPEYREVMVFEAAFSVSTLATAADS